MKEKDDEEENLIENINEKDNKVTDDQNQNEKSSDIDQINNIENINIHNNLSQSGDSLISEESNDKLKKIFEKYNLNIKSLIYTNPPNTEDVFLVLIFTGTINFVKKYIYSARRKNTFVKDEENNKNQEENHEIELNNEKIK